MDSSKVKELRLFGLIAGCIFIFLLGLAFPYLAKSKVSYPFIFAGSALVFMGAAFPRHLRHIHGPWVWAGGKVMHFLTVLILAAIYYLAISPMGTWWRVLGKDPMRKQFEPSAETYRIFRNDFDAKFMERPF